MAKGKFRPKFQISFSKILRNKWHHVKSTGRELSSEWSHHRISSIDSKVRVTLQNLLKHSIKLSNKQSSRLIRECADLISPYISIIFNCCLTTGTFPDDWKLAKVTPMFKQGDRSDMNNYHPIFVISGIAKVFERIVYNQLSSYLSENNILSKYQSGFRSFHSTVTALLEATDNWAFNIDRGYVNAVVFLDLKKAFDTVNHSILLSKLYSYGVKGIAYELLSSYLENRTQKCAVKGVLSKSCTWTCGISQGTKLGPLLFLLYINVLPNCLSNSQPRMYADDTHLT